VRLQKDAVEQALLGGDVVIKTSLEQPDRIGHVLERGGCIALLREDLDGGLENLGIAIPAWFAGG
jgi:hypothetical protein